MGWDWLGGIKARMMRDFKRDIDRTHDPNVLREVLGELHREIETMAESPYEEASVDARIHDLELLFRYGEHKLARLLG